MRRRTPGSTSLRARLFQRLFRSPLYRHLLRGRERVAVGAGTDPWHGDPARANALFQGRYRFAGSEVQLFNRPPWGQTVPPIAWQAEASSFVWLRDFRADGGGASREGARELVRTWIDAYSNWHPVAWRPDVVGARLLAWTGHADFLLDGADSAFQHRFLISMDAQARHLWRARELAPAGVGTVSALGGLLAYDTMFGGSSRRVARVIDGLEAELTHQVFDDGCVASRDPSDQLALLRELVWIAAAREAAKLPVPLPVRGAIERMAPVLGLFRHGDGGLALFHGSQEEERGVVAETLSAVVAKVRPLAAVPQGGYERLAGAATLVLLDAGSPPPPPYDADAHAGTLAFELSVGRERLVVNCGHRPGANWRPASCSTAAHSTLVLGDQNSAEILPAGLGERPGTVAVKRQEDLGNTWLDAAHDGYVRRFGLIHRRRVYLSADGTTFRGEDVLEGPGGGKETVFTVRFHLHPDVQVSLVPDGALLRLPGGSGWRFRAAGGLLSLEESVYLGRPGETRRAEQIVISGSAAPTGAIVKWAFARVEGT